MTGLRASMVIQCDGPTCGCIREFVTEGNFKSEGPDAKEVDLCEGWFFSDVQDLCPSCLGIQQRMIGKSKWNYLKDAPREEVSKFEEVDSPSAASSK